MYGRISTDSLLEIIHRRYQVGSTIIATKRPIEDWGAILGDNAVTSAVLDRFLENIHYLKITVKSYRLKNLKIKIGVKDIENNQKTD